MPFPNGYRGAHGTGGGARDHGRSRSSNGVPRGSRKSLSPPAGWRRHLRCTNGRFSESVFCLRRPKRRHRICGNGIADWVIDAVMLVASIGLLTARSSQNHWDSDTSYPEIVHKRGNEFGCYAALRDAPCFQSSRPMQFPQHPIPNMLWHDLLAMSCDQSQKC